MFDANKIKKDFPIFENYRHENGADLSYLDSAASSQTPRQVVEAMDDYYFKYRSNIHRSLYAIGEKATGEYEKARETVAQFINADTDEVIFTGGATASSNMLIYALEGELNLKEGDEILTTVAEHHSNLIPLQELAHRGKLTLKHIGIDKDSRFDIGSLPALITPKTKIVSVTLASNVTGEIIDARRVAETAHKAGAVVILDATKAAGHMPIDVRDFDCDFLFFSGHKICGPTGIGVLYGKREFLGKMKPSFFGGGIIESADLKEAVFSPSPSRFEPGTPNIAGAIGLAQAVRFIENIGLPEIKKHSEKLVSYAIKKLSAIPEVKILCEREPSRNIGIVSFVVDGVHPHDLAEILSRGHVAIRGGHHCAMPFMKELGVTSVNRASFYVYNNEGDIDALSEGVKNAIKIFSR